MVSFGASVRRGHPFLFGLLVLVTAVEGAICTWYSVMTSRHHNWVSITVRDTIRLLAFVSWWTFLGSLAFTVLAFHSFDGSVLTSVLSYAVFLGLVWIFWTAGAANLTAKLGGGINCSKVEENIVYCNQLNAATGFAWASWLLVTIALAVTFICGVRSARQGNGLRGPLV